MKNELLIKRNRCLIAVSVCLTVVELGIAWQRTAGVDGTVNGPLLAAFGGFAASAAYGSACKYYAAAKGYPEDLCVLSLCLALVVAVGFIYFAETLGARLGPLWWELMPAIAFGVGAVPLWLLQDRTPARVFQRERA